MNDISIVVLKTTSVALLRRKLKMFMNLHISKDLDNQETGKSYGFIDSSITFKKTLNYRQDNRIVPIRNND